MRSRGMKSTSWKSIPRASRTVPFVSKATGVPLAKIATKIMIGISLMEQGLSDGPVPKHFSVKESVLPFNRFPGVDTILGPEMKSTGEVMGMDAELGIAYAKSQIAAGQTLPKSGWIFISVKDYDKDSVIDIAKQFSQMGFDILSTDGTGRVFQDHNIPVTVVPRLKEGRPNILDYIKNRQVGLIINTPSGPIPRQDEVSIRSTAVAHGIPLVTTVAGAVAMANGIRALQKRGFDVRSLQEIYAS